MRITKQHRESIKTKVLYSILAPLEKELATASIKAGDAIYASVVTAACRGIMGALPRDYFRVRKCLCVKYGRDFIELPLSNPQPFPFKWEYNGSVVALIGVNDPAYKHYEEIAAIKARIDDKRVEILEHITPLLNSCHTFNALLKAWPEGEKFFPIGWNKVSTAVIPHDAADALNKMIKDANK